MPLFSQKLQELLKLKELLRFMEDYATTEANADVTFTKSLPHQEDTDAMQNGNDVTHAQTADVTGTPIKNLEKSVHNIHKRSISDIKELDYNSNEISLFSSELNELMFESDTESEEDADYFRNIHKVLRHLILSNNIERPSRRESSVTGSSTGPPDKRYHELPRSAKTGNTFSKSVKKGKRSTEGTEYVMKNRRSLMEEITSIDGRKRRKRRSVEKSFEVRDMKRSLSHLLSKANSEKSRHLKEHRNVFDKIKHLKEKVFLLRNCFNFMVLYGEGTLNFYSILNLSSVEDFKPQL